ncbi:4-hydroxy-tetrahydrodipicolinate reductase [Bdellovibrio sp. qaytius]|nr:4-hydroxy-tetrahydrodipicolinate reductase [Bdellovibrio sp. qaytius]
MAKKIKLGLFGSTGKMGVAIRQLIKNSSEFNAFLEVCSKPTGDFDLSYINLDEISQQTFKQVDVWIDFSRPEGLLELLPIVQQTKKPLISGTTGFENNQFSKVEACSKKTAIFWASNMSVGLWTLRQAIKTLSTISHFDFALEEIHHTQKKDNPSGTAVTLHKDLEKAVGKKIAPAVGHRLGGVFGIHTITAASQSEMIKLEHNALNRTVFAEGALKAALWIVKQPAGLYSMDDLMTIKRKK